jgi:SAM-dependent methyltransferase
LSRAPPESRQFKDHFSGHASDYSAYRPTYPDELFDFLASCCATHRHAWDCATGSGQTALALTAFFERVTATDASAEQVAAASRHARIDYRVAPAEASGLGDGSVDLVTVSQALHWFDIDGFFGEARRVLAAGGVLAAWSYDLCRVDSSCDAVIGEIYEALDAFWPPERRIVEARYAGIEMPLPELAAPTFEMVHPWTVDDILGYMRTWSAYRRCLKETGVDEVAKREDRLRAAWNGGSGGMRDVRWPLALRIGRA